jgi:pimeloyl-ACP methyl ester carboxylesterase
MAGIAVANGVLSSYVRFYERPISHPRGFAMRRWMATPLLCVLVAALCPNSTPRALAADNEPSEETFLTADGMQLHGLFLKSAVNPGVDPVVILLYPPGKGNSMKGPGDWEGLAARLSKEGYNTFRFDWRGHGKSTTIKDAQEFWGNPFTGGPGNWNMKYIQGAPTMAVGKIKNDFYFKDFKSPQAAVNYTPTYMLDLAAARYHLDGKNDNGDVNMSSVYLIGSDSAATIGFGWMAAEWNRPATTPNLIQLGPLPLYKFIPQKLVGGINTAAGDDISGAVWLTPTRPESFPVRSIQDWVSKGAPKLRDNNPMLFLVGDKDVKGAKAVKLFFDEVLVANPPKSSSLQKLDQTFMKEVKGGGVLTGAALLGQNAQLKTEDTIIQFLAAIQKNRAKIVRKTRGFTNPYAIDLSVFGVAP